MSSSKKSPSTKSAPKKSAPVKPRAAPKARLDEPSAPAEMGYDPKVTRSDKNTPALNALTNALANSPSGFKEGHYGPAVSEKVAPLHKQLSDLFHNDPTAFTELVARARGEGLFPDWTHR